MKTPLLLPPLVALSVGVFAQTAPAPPPPSDPAGEVVQLGRFEVSTEKDNGYMAADTISSGRLSTSLLMTPSDTSVITRDLLDDLGLFSADEATGWLTNSRPLELGAIENNSVNPSTMDNGDGGSTGTLRGMSTQPGTRNYFPSGTTPLEYNLDRVEGARGPNAILYGEGAPGGQINYLTKKARTRNFATLRLRADSEGTVGASVDINRTFGRRFALRYNGSWFDGQGWQARVKNNHVGNALSLVFRPTPTLTIGFDADQTRTYRSGMISQFIDNSSNWNRAPLTGPVRLTAAQATAAGLNILGNTVAKYRVYTEGLGIIDWKGYGQSNGLGLTVMPGLERGVPNFPVAPDRRFNTQPEQVNIAGRTRDLMATAEQRFDSGLIVELALASAAFGQDGANVRYSQTYIDPNTQLPDGRPNPNFGKMYSAAFYGRNLDGSTRDSRSVRLAGNYPWSLFRGVQNVSLIAQRQENESRVRQGLWRIVDQPSAANPITNNANQFFIFRYWDNLPARLPDFSSQLQFRDVPERDARTERHNNSIQLGTAGSYLRNRLSVVGGLRYDEVKLRTADGNLASRDPITGEIGAYTRAAYRTSNRFASGGLVYFPFESVGLYANMSDGFSVQTNSNPRIDGSFAEVGIVPSTVKAGGLRFRLFGGRLVGSAGYYRAKESGSALTVTVKQINNIWRNHPGFGDRVIETFSPTLENITDTQSREGWGWEGEMTASLANALRFTANVAFPQTSQTDVGRDFRGYVAANLAQWERWAADASDPIRQATDILNLRGVQTSIASFQDGRRQNGTYKWRANVFGTYTFRSTPFKGGRFGLGAQVFGPRLIGNRPNLPYDYLYSTPHAVLTASLGRSFKIFERKVDLQLNVANLLDYDRPVVHGVFLVSGVQQPYGFKYLPPRLVRLTATLNF